MPRRASDDYLNAMAARLDDPDDYVRWLAEKLERAERAGAPAESGEHPIAGTPVEEEPPRPRLTARGRSSDR